MGIGLTPSEKLVNELCEKSFLKLWTHPNPIGKKGKELCDCLIVCDKHIVIISVKEIEYKDTDSIVGYERWTKAAIDKSVDQICGAQRWLESNEKLTRHDGRIVSLPNKNERKYHRVSVSLGSNGKIPIKVSEDFKCGLVHICNEKSFKIIFSELDTIIDFVDFLEETEKLMNNNIGIIFDSGGLEDLIGLYMESGYSLNINQKTDLLFLSDNIWDRIENSKEYLDMKEDFKSSYFWDMLIEHYTNDLLTDGFFNIHDKKVTKNELAFVAMALQPRRYRANLADSFMIFLKEKILSRLVIGYNKTAFVFLKGQSTDREMRNAELLLRCSIVSHKLSGKIDTVIGIARDGLTISEIGYSSDIVYMYKPNWSNKEKKELETLQKEMDYFNNINKIYNRI